ncbi:MAG: penicillin acylase family protein [Bacteroidota bacterium]
MKQLKALLSLLLTVALVYALNSKLGPAPPVGKFLSPFTGFWQNAEGEDMDKAVALPLAGLKGKVTVLFDDKHIPHIFADNNYDIYFAQGYITARDRLWQMEFQTHAAAGRLCEIVGEKALPLDRYQRRMGTVYGAESSLKGMMSDPATRDVLEAYTAGINAYIAQLLPKDYPLEYKLLDYAPEPWTPLKVALLSKQMTHTLAGSSDDLRMTNILNKYGSKVVKDLYPDYPFYESPIIPVGTPLDFTPLKVPDAPQSFVAKMTGDSLMKEKEEGIGSNNWAVSAEKSATGYPILANDPHLNLTLPSIWYQIQLVSPDLNVYGASLPGAPGVIIGFNHDVAWGVTNVDADVMDWYEIRFKDGSRNEYWHDGQWKPIKKRLEEIKIHGKASVVDTVLYTHHGPVVYNPGEKPYNEQVPIGHAMRWIAFEESNDVSTFYQLNRAKNYDDYLKALSHYNAPAQNFIFADNEKDIAIWPNGKYPLKWKNQGKFVLDGTDSAYDWQGWIPQAQNPHVKNPPRGFVSSANQSSTDTLYPYYLNWEFAPPERGIRINQRLEAMNRATPDSLRMLQNDNFSINAQVILPALLPLVQTTQLNADQLTVLKEVSTWKYNNDANAIGPSIFELWRTHLNKAIWADEFGNREGQEMRFPSRDRTVQMILHEPQARWFDNIQTVDKQETLAELVNLTFKATADTLLKKYGKPGDSWQWGRVKGTDIMHLARIPALSRMDLLTGGGSSIVNATTERNGPSWRMVVALGKEPKAYGVYPGGQSGNPGSPYYDNLIETWRKGELNELLYLYKPDDTNSRIVSRWTLSKIN